MDFVNVVDLGEWLHNHTSAANAARLSRFHITYSNALAKTAICAAYYCNPGPRAARVNASLKTCLYPARVR